MFFLLLVCSCTNEMETEMKDGLFSFSSMSASMGDLPTSRTHLENDGRVVWDVNDQVGIFSDTQATPVSFTCMSVDDSKASFSANDEVSGNSFYAFYPYENSSVKDNIIKFTLPNYTEYTANTYFHHSPMISKSNTNNFQFKHTCGILHFTITSTKKIYSVTLSGNNDEVIAGTGTIDLNSDTPILNIPSDSEDGSQTATIDIPRHMNNIKDFYFVVPTGNYTKGITLTIEYTDNDQIYKINKTTSKSITISRSIIKSFKVFDIDQLIEDERDNNYSVLMALYNATNGENWTNNTNWGSDKPCSEWNGCFFTDGILHSISLNNNNLTGQIPSELGNLSYLEELDLGCNNLTGNIPSELGNLNKLERLHLGNNQLTGIIPNELGNLQSLKSLELGQNQLTGNLPNTFSNLSKLTYLHLGWNQLEGIIPSSWGNMNSLEELHLYYNKLSGSIPNDLGNIKSLTYLHIGDNLLTGEIPLEISNLENLEILSFSNNQLEGTIPESFVNLQKLKHLYLDYNKLNGICSEELSSFIEDLDYYNITQIGEYNVTLYFYYSTDFEKDGEYRLLQEHTKGNGIKIVITLDAFTDKEIKDGTAEEYIEKAYAALFSEEPYSSLREYFDVYSLISVSYRKKIGTNTALGTTYNGDNFLLNYEMVETHVKKINELNDELSNTHILVILNDKSLYRANSAWVTYGSISCANIKTDADLAKTIKHEVLGHGIGKLGDEYVEAVMPGLDNPYEGYFPEDTKQAVWDLHKNDYYLNVDVTNDPTKIVWKDFLSNTDYASEVGIFEGALYYAKGAYRPSAYSIMYENWGGFNAPSRWAIYKNVLEAAGETPTFENFLEYDKKNLNKAQTTSSRSVIETPIDKRRIGAPPVFLNR